jgi:hypothetical protein
MSGELTGTNRAPPLSNRPKFRTGTSRKIKNYYRPLAVPEALLLEHASSSRGIITGTRVVFSRGIITGTGAVSKALLLNTKNNTYHFVSSDART